MRKFSGGVLLAAYFVAASLAVASPGPVEAFTVIAGPTIAGGQSHALAVQSDGTVLGVGWGYLGQLGTDPQSPGFSPIPGLSRITAVAATDHASIALRSDGTVWTFGFNWLGQLGRTETSGSTFTPTQVPELTGIISVAAGKHHVAALRSDGTVWTFGSNMSGELGWPTSTNSLQPNPTPRMVENLSNIVAVTAGTHYTAALRSDGTVWTFGSNTFGQLGPNTNVGTSRPSWYPVQVPELTGITSISAGGAHTLALRADGTVLGFGGNLTGQLGNAFT